MTKPETARELVGRTDPPGVLELARRVETVLVFCLRDQALFADDIEHSDPIVSKLALGRMTVTEQVLLLLNGQKP